MLITEMLTFMSFRPPRELGIKILPILLTCLIMFSCNKEDSKIDNDIEMDAANTVPLPKRPGSRPQTTTDIPHVQIGVEPVTEVNEELFRRVYSIPGIENISSVIGRWRGLSLTEEVDISVPEALIGDREFGHIHDDGSLHIFLKSSRSKEAVKTCWATFHPFAVQELEGWDGFVMLYTPQSIDELNVTFQLIVDGYNYVTGQNLIATDYY